jgi:hypothetical protein
VTYTSADPSIAPVNGAILAFNAVGTTTITVSQMGNGTYNAAADQYIVVNITNQPIFQPQSILGFNSFDPQMLGDPQLTLSGVSATSELPITFISSNPSVAIIKGNIITLFSAGITTITVVQLGNSTYEPIALSQKLIVLEKTNVVTIPALGSIVSNGTLTIAGFKASPCYDTYQLSIPSITGQTYQWYFNNLKLIGSTENIYDPVVDGSYFVIASDSMQSYVYDPYIVNVLSYHQPVVAVSNDSTLLTSTPADLYQWYLDEYVIHDATSQSLKIWYKGNYYVVTENKQDGCKLRSETSSDINKGLRTIFEGGLIIQDSTIQNYGPGSYQGIVVKIHPNPAKEGFTIEADGSGQTFHYLISDLLGNVIEKGEMKKIGNKFFTNANHSQLLKGIYFVKVESELFNKCSKIVID